MFTAPCLVSLLPFLGPDPQEPPPPPPFRQAPDPHAPHPGGHPAPRSQGPGLPFQEALKLTEAQTQAVQATFQRHRPLVHQAERTALDTESALHRAALDPEASEDTLKRLHEAASQARFQVLRARHAAQVEAFGHLTEPQKAQSRRIHERVLQARAAREALREALGEDGPMTGPEAPGTPLPPHPGGPR